MLLQILVGADDVVGQRLCLGAGGLVGGQQFAGVSDGGAYLFLAVSPEVLAAQHRHGGLALLPADAGHVCLHLRQLLVVFVPLVGALGYEREDFLQSLYLLVERGLCYDAALVERFDNLLRVAVEVVQLLAALLDHFVQVALLLQVFGVALADAALAGFGSVDGALQFGTAALLYLAQTDVLHHGLQGRRTLDEFAQGLVV